MPSITVIHSAPVFGSAPIAFRTPQTADARQNLQIYPVRQQPVPLMTIANAMQTISVWQEAAQVTVSRQNVHLSAVNVIN